MFRFVNRLTQDTEDSMPDDMSDMMNGNDEETIQISSLSEQPMILSAVEATLSSYYKDEGDDLLDMLEKNAIKVMFDDNLPGEAGNAHYMKDDNLIVLSSQPHDILDMAKEMHRVLNQLKTG